MWHSSELVEISLFNFRVWNIQLNHGKATLFSSSVSIQMLFQTQVVYMVDALWLKVRNGQQQSGFMSILLTPSWETIRTAPMKIQVVRDGLNSVSARITRSIWSDLPSFLATAGKVVRCVHKIRPLFMCIPCLCVPVLRVFWEHFNCNVLWELECVLITQSCNIIWTIM